VMGHMEYIDVTESDSSRRGRWAYWPSHNIRYLKIV